MNLAEALDAALRDRYPVPQVRRPATHRQGLTARLNALEKLHARQGDRPGAAGRRAAKAIGIAPDTWTRWKNGQRKPSAASLRKIEGAYARNVVLPKMRTRVNNLPVPNSVTVTAVINWNGYKNRQQHRSTTLGNMRTVMVHVIRAWANLGPDAAADAFERGAAENESVSYIKFEGDDVEVRFPYD